jgi:hypothetical protein
MGSTLQSVWLPRTAIAQRTVLGGDPLARRKESEKAN